MTGHQALQRFSAGAGMPGTTCGNQAPGDAKPCLLKYLGLALIPLPGWAFMATVHRRRALQALACGLALVAVMTAVCLFNSALLDHTEGLLYAWLTALLHAGLQSAAPASASSV